MSRAKAAATLCRRALSARALAASPPAPPLARSYAIGTAAATAAAATAAGGTTLRVFGYQVPYSWILGGSLGLGLGVFFYETLHTARMQDQPLQQVLHARPSIASLNMTDQAGRTVTAATLAGKHALMTFGSVVRGKEADLAGLNVAVRAAEAAKERTGATVVPLFLGLDPAHDRPDHLRKIAQAAGSPALLALTGDADGVLACADKFKKQELAARMAAMKDQEHYKRDDVYDAMDISDFVFLISPEGHFVKCWPRDSPVTGIATEVAQYIKS